MDKIVASTFELTQLPTGARIKRAEYGRETPERFFTKSVDGTFVADDGAEFEPDSFRYAIRDEMVTVVPA
jgi:hypothetical protein